MAVTDATDLANACGEYTPPYDGTTVRGAAVQSSSEDYLVTSAASSLYLYSGEAVAGYYGTYRFVKGGNSQIARLNGILGYWSMNDIDETGSSIEEVIDDEYCVVYHSSSGRIGLSAGWSDTYNGLVTKTVTINIS